MAFAASIKLPSIPTRMHVLLPYEADECNVHVVVLSTKYEVVLTLENNAKDGGEQCNELEEFQLSSFSTASKPLYGFSSTLHSDKRNLERRIFNAKPSM